MCPPIDISDLTEGRLQKIAIPLRDTHDSVIARLLDVFEATQSGRRGEVVAELSSGRKQFDPATPPNLAFTTCTQITVEGGKPFPKNISYWNNLLIAVIQVVNEKGRKSAESIADMIHFANCFVGRKEDNGYKYLESVGLSVQGLDANGAFRQAYFLAVTNGVKFTVEFEWQDNEKAVLPLQRGYFDV